MKGNVLVTDGGERAALAIVRSLARNGYRVHVTASRTPSLAGASRHAASEHAAPDPVREPEAYREFVRNRVETEGMDVLVPTAEASLVSLLPLRTELPGLTIPFPPIENFLRICDKAGVLHAAREIGIDVPEQTVVASPDALPGPERELSFPLVVKPARSVARGASALLPTQVRRAHDAGELRRLASSVPREAYPLLLQRPVQGPGVGIFLLVWNGEVLAAFAHRRIREKPPSGGVSVFRESIPLDLDLLRRSRQLLERFEWQGVAMVEYKLDEPTGRHVLMEVNGRFWGSLQLAVDAGVDFPSLLLSAARGEEMVPSLGYRSGVRCRWWWGEVDHVVGLLRNGEPALLGRSNGSRSRALRTALRGWLTPGRSEVLRWSDPGPFLRESLAWVREAVRR